MKFNPLWAALCFVLAAAGNPYYSSILTEAKTRFPEYPLLYLLVVNTKTQRIHLLQKGNPIKEYVVSTGNGGASSLSGSHGTPLGWHRIWIKVGDEEPEGRLIWYKQVTNVMIPITTDETLAGGDYLITRVLGLDGLEEGFNKGGRIDSLIRGINIHGTPEEGRLGRNVSHGCVRMKNSDVVELYNIVPLNTLVYITNE